MPLGVGTQTSYLRSAIVALFADELLCFVEANANLRKC